MIEIQAISMDTLYQIRDHSLPGGSGQFFDQTGNCYTQLIFFRQPNGHVALYVADVCQLPSGDALVGEIIIDVDQNPELFDLYDWDETMLVFDEVDHFLNDNHIAGSVSQFGDQSPTTTITTHSS